MSWLTSPITNGLSKHQARCLVERQDDTLWARVLSSQNEFHPKVIAQVIQVALSETDSPEEVSSAVKALMAADLQDDLSELLENLFLSIHSEEPDNAILTMTAHPEVWENTLFQEVIKRFSFLFFRLFLPNLSSFTFRVTNVDVHYKAVRFFITEKRPDCLLEQPSNNHEYFTNNVINVANERHLFFARTHLQSQCLVKSKKLEIGVHSWCPFAIWFSFFLLRCFQNRMFKAAKLLFSSISNYPRLCSTLIQLEDWEGAVEAARKASSTRTWKEANLACVDAG